MIILVDHSGGLSWWIILEDLLEVYCVVYIERLLNGK